MKPALLIPLLALVLLGATWSFGHFDVRREQQTANEQRWASLSGAERDALRERWDDLRTRLRAGDDDAEVLRRRLGALNRLMQQPAARPLQGEELDRHLERLPTLLQDYLGLAPEMRWEPGELVVVLRADTNRRMNAFLGNLSHEGLVDNDDLARFHSASWDGKVEFALELLKREALIFEAEEPAAELEELEELSPLDLAARQLEERRRRGLLGRAGRLLPLSDEESRRLYDATDEDFERAFRDIVRPAARRLLLAEGVPEERVDELVSRPYRSLERIMERLLLARR